MTTTITSETKSGDTTTIVGDHGITDTKGRKIGGTVEVFPAFKYVLKAGSAHEYERQYLPGTYAVVTQATRGGLKFGASTRGKLIKGDEATAIAAGRKSLHAQGDRYRKQAAR